MRRSAQESNSGKAGISDHVDAGADDRGRRGQRLSATGTSADRCEDQRGVSGRGGRLIGSTRSRLPELDVANCWALWSPRAGLNGTSHPLWRSTLRDDVGGGAESVDPSRCGRACEPQRAVSDQQRSTSARGLLVVVSVGQANT